MDSERGVVRTYPNLVGAMYQIQSPPSTPIPALSGNPESLSAASLIS